MATTTNVTIEMRDTRRNRVPVGSGETVYDGAFGVVNGSGYLENPDSATVTARTVGVIQIPDKDSTGAGYLTATANGSVSANTNCVDLIDKGIIKATFNSVAITDVGNMAFIYDNCTLTASAISGITPFGIITKYIDSTHAEVELDPAIFNGEFVIINAISGGTTSTTAGALMNIVNPFGQSVYLRDCYIRVATPASSAVSGQIGIANSANSSAENIIGGTTAIMLGTAGLYHAGNTTDGHPNQVWNSTQYLTMYTTNVVGSALVAYFYAKVRAL